MLVTCSNRVHNMMLAQAKHREYRGDTGIDLIPIPALYCQCPTNQIVKKLISETEFN